MAQASRHITCENNNNNMAQKIRSLSRGSAVPRRLLGVPESDGCMYIVSYRLWPAT
jgi:hypothetical protein